MHQINDYLNTSLRLPLTSTTITSEKLSSLPDVLTKVTNLAGDYIYRLLPGYDAEPSIYAPLLNAACQQAQQCLLEPPRTPEELLALLRKNIGAEPVKACISEMIKQQQTTETGRIGLLPEIIEPLMLFTPAQLEKIITLALLQQISSAEYLYEKKELTSVILNEIYREANKDLPAFSLPPAALEKLAATLVAFLFPFSPITPANENKFLMQQIMLLLSDFTSQNLIEIHRQPFSIFSAVAALISLSGKAFNALSLPAAAVKTVEEPKIKQLMLPGFRLAGSCSQVEADKTTVAANSCALYTSNQPQSLAFCPTPGNRSAANDIGQPQVRVALALSGDSQQAAVAIQSDRQPVLIEHHPRFTASVAADWPASAPASARLMLTDGAAAEPVPLMLTDGIAVEPALHPARFQPPAGALNSVSPGSESWLTKLKALLEVNIHAPFPTPSAISNLMFSSLFSRIAVNAAASNPSALDSAALWRSLATPATAPQGSARRIIYNPQSPGDPRAQFAQLVQHLSFSLSPHQQEKLFSHLKTSLVILTPSLPARKKRISEQESHQRCLINAAIEVEQSGVDRSLGGRMISWGEGMNQQSLATFRTILSKGDYMAWIPSGFEAAIGQLAISVGKVANGQAFKPEPCQDKASWALESAVAVVVPPEGAGARAFRATASKPLRPLLTTAVKAGPAKGSRVSHPETGLSLHTVLQGNIDGKPWLIIPQGNGRGIAFQPGHAPSGAEIAAIRTQGNQWTVGSLGAHRFSRADKLYVKIDNLHYQVHSQAADGSLRLSNGIRVWFDWRTKQWKEFCPGNTHLDTRSLSILPEKLLSPAPGNQRVLSHARGINPESKLWRDHHNRQDVLEVQARIAGSNKIEVKYMPGKREGNFFTISPGPHQPVSQQQVLRWNPAREKWDVASPFSQLPASGDLPLVSYPAAVAQEKLPGLCSVADGRLLLRWSSDASGADLWLPLEKTSSDSIFRHSENVFVRYDLTAEQWHLHRVTAEAFIDIPESVKLRPTYPFSDDYAMPGFRNAWRKDGRIFIKISEEGPELATYIEVSQSRDRQHFTLRIVNQQGPDTLWNFSYQDDQYRLEAKQLCARSKRASDDECVAGPSQQKRPAEAEEEASGSKRQKVLTVDSDAPTDSDLNEALETEMTNTESAIVAQGVQAAKTKINDKMTVQNIFETTISILQPLAKSATKKTRTQFISKIFGDVNLARKTRLFDDITTLALENLRSYLPGGKREDQLILAESRSNFRIGTEINYQAKVLSYPNSDRCFLVINYDNLKNDASHLSNPITLMKEVKMLLHETSHIKPPVSDIAAGKINIATRDFYYSPSDRLSQMSGNIKPYEHRIMHYSLDNDLALTEANEPQLERKSYSDYAQEKAEDSQEYHLSDDEKNFYSLTSDMVNKSVNELREHIIKYNALLEEINAENAAGNLTEEEIQFNKEDEENLRLTALYADKRLVKLLNAYNEALQALGLPEQKLGFTSLLKEPDPATGMMAIDAEKVALTDNYLKQFASNKESRVAALMKTADFMADLIILLAGETGTLDRVLPEPLLEAPDPALPWEASDSEDSERR